MVEDYSDVPAAIRAEQTQTTELKQTPMPVMREWYRVTCLRYMPEVRALDMVQVGGRSYTIQIPDAQQETMTTHLLVYLIP